MTSDWTRQATAAVRAALVPVLREMGFRGSFPSYRRIEAGQVAVVHLDVRARTGVTIETHSLPPGSKLGTWRSERQRRVICQIRSSVAASALPRRLASLSRRFRREAEAFYRESAGHWSREARSARKTATVGRDAVARALLSGDARALAALTKALDEDAFVAAVVNEVERNDAERVAPALWKCAPVLLRYDWFSDKIGASLAASAATARPSKSTQQARRWIRPHLTRLAPWIAFAARRALYESDNARASSIFGILLERAEPLANLGPPEVACALYSVVRATPAKRPPSPVVRRLLSSAARVARTDPYVRVNLACLRGELPPSAARLPWERM